MGGCREARLRVVVNQSITRVEDEMEQRVRVWLLRPSPYLHWQQEQPEESEYPQQPRQCGPTTDSMECGEPERAAGVNHQDTVHSDDRVT